MKLREYRKLHSLEESVAHASEELEEGEEEAAKEKGMQGQTEINL